jgi:hypothetical protein
MPDRELIHLDRQNDLIRLKQEFSFKQLDGVLTAISESMFYLESNINSKLLMHNLGAQLWKA